MHAEWMAIAKLLVCGSGVSTKNAFMYLTAQPCEICAKLIVGAEIGTIVLLEGVYPVNGEEILRDGGVEIRYVKIWRRRETFDKGVSVFGNLLFFLKKDCAIIQYSLIL